MQSLLREFKEFAFRGNLIELAVAVILAIQFNGVVQSLSHDILLNFIAALFGQPDFGALVWNLNGGQIFYGNFINAVVNFVIVAWALFVIVRVINRLRRPRNASPEPPETRECPYCLSAVAISATRCPACTSEVKPLTPRAA